LASERNKELQLLVTGAERGQSVKTPSQPRSAPIRLKDGRELTAEEVNLCVGLSKKSSARLRRWFELDLDFHKFASGVNVFQESGQKFMEVLGWELISRRQVVGKDMVSKLMDELNWTRGTASAHWAQAKACLLAVNVVELSAVNIIVMRGDV